MKDFSQKLKKIPTDIQEILTSIKAADLNLELAGKYQIKPGDISSLVDLVAMVFLKELPLSGLESAIKKSLGLSDELSRGLARDMAGIRLLIVKDWLGVDVAAYIKSLGGNPLEYSHYSEDQKKAIIEERKYYQEQNDQEEIFEMPIKKDDYIVPEFDVEKEKNESVKIFSEALVDLLNMTNAEFLREYNHIVIKILFDDSAFKDELEKSLYINNEILTTKPFVLEGKNQNGTIANWLKDFIKANGSEFFNAIVLSKYVTASPNVKLLDKDEKALVDKLLKLYRNLVFFPNSLANVPIEKWEIFPISETPQERSIPTFSGHQGEETGMPVEKVLEPIMPIVEPGVKPAISDLEDLLKTYPENSLEYRAILEEIKKKK